MRQLDDSAFASWPALLDLVRDRNRESVVVEFKRAPYAGLEKSPDLQRKERDELRRDVTSLANAGGGWLVIGISESAQGEAEALVAIPRVRDHETRTRDVLCDRVEPPFGVSLSVRSVHEPGADGSGAIVVHVERAAPHRPYAFARESGPLEFWLRADTSKRPMTYGQIVQAFTPSGDELQAHHIAAIARSRVQDLRAGIRSANRSWEAIRPILGELRRYCEDPSMEVVADVIRAAHEAIDYPRAGLPLELAREAAGVLRDALPIHSLNCRQGRPPTPEELGVLEEAVEYLWPLV